MSWDDSGMNITVNPLDDVEKNVVDDDFSDDDESSDGEERSLFLPVVKSFDLGPVYGSPFRELESQTQSKLTSSGNSGNGDVSN
ncbi:unnamed protein product [Nippostrongylus brasiliensis]|uniref:SIT4 phosphatase-associated family protein n=1 Tax=Nippostrongylus brasiliensis TaxID=27835 RepID=A0A0N4YS29_NIPBR|nr:unnamed protein product [Nippostrongylus brasiliensis]